MFLTKDSKSPYYQLVYFVDGKRTKISTKTSDREEAEKFKASFNLLPKTEPKAKKVSIRLNSFVIEYKNYVSNTYSESYLKKAVTSSFNRLQNYLPDLPIDAISTRHIDKFISSVAATSKYAASLYYRTLKAAFNKAVVWNDLRGLDKLY